MFDSFAIHCQFDPKKTGRWTGQGRNQQCLTLWCFTVILSRKELHVGQERVGINHVFCGSLCLRLWDFTVRLA